MSTLLPAFQGLQNAGRMGSFVSANNQQASARQIQRHDHEKTVYGDNVSAILSSAVTFGFTKNGYELDEAAIDAAVQRKLAGEATPQLDGFAAGLANTTFADQLAQYFEFDSVVATPEGDMTLEGSYKAGPNQGTRAPMTDAASDQDEDPVALIPKESVGGLLSTAYSTILNDPMYATKNLETQRLIMLGRENASSRAKAGAFTAVVTRELAKVAGPEQARALMVNLGAMTPNQQVVYLRDNIVPAMQTSLDQLGMDPDAKASIEQTQPDDSDTQTQNQNDETAVDPNAAAEIEKLNNELQSLPTGRGGAARRTAIKAKIKSLGASSEAKEFADSADGSEVPQEVSEDEESGLMAWAKENPVDAAMLAASGALLLMGPAGWAMRGGLTALRATPAAAKWIAGQAAKKGPGVVRGAVSKPKYTGKPRNAQGQLTTKGNEARQFSAGRAGATGIVLTGASVGLQEVLTENPELENESDATKSAVTKGVNSANDDLQNGKGPSFTQQELNDFAAFLNKKGITNVEGAVDESTDVKQTLLAVLSVTIADPTRRAQAQTKFMNLMETGNQGFSAKELATANTASRNATTSERAQTTAENRLALDQDQNVRSADAVVETYDTTIDEAVKAQLIDEDGGSIEPKFEQINRAWFGGQGIVTKLIRRMRTQEQRYKDTGTAQSKRLFEQYKDRAMAQISLAMQLGSADGGLEWSAATESGSISGSDKFLSRIRENTDGGFDIVYPGSDRKDGDAYTKDQALQLMGGDTKIFDLFVSELEKSAAARKRAAVKRNRKQG